MAVRWLRQDNLPARREVLPAEENARPVGFPRGEGVIYPDRVRAEGFELRVTEDGVTMRGKVVCRYRFKLANGQQIDLDLTWDSEEFIPGAEWMAKMVKWGYKP